MRLALFCGSSPGNDPLYTEQTRRLARAMGHKGMSLVYGGGKVGLMGAVADEALASGVHVVGVMPDALVEHELAHPAIHELIVVRNMHERKLQMAERADAFIALPGGAGTMEEIFEAWTWAQLGFHNKPCGFLNIAGYYDGLLTFIRHMATQGFIRQSYVDMLVVSDDPDTLIAALEHYTPPAAKWAAGGV